MDEHGPDIPEQRQYLPTLAELIDRLSIVLMKSIFIQEHREAYLVERKLIEHDIDLLLKEKQYVWQAEDMTAALMLMLTNRFIWENESKARQGGDQQDLLLKLTHSINGIRNQAKNVISGRAGDRVDLKLDCFAAELIKEFGNWSVIEMSGISKQSDTYILTRVNEEEFRQLQDRPLPNDNGLPRYYYIDKSGMIRLWPAPWPKTNLQSFDWTIKFEVPRLFDNGREIKK